MVPMRVFVSHSHHDSSFCQDLVQALRKAGTDVWYDEDDMSYGELTGTIRRKIHSCSVFIIVLSPNALDSEWVHDEAKWAHDFYKLAKSKKDLTRIIIPVTVAPIDSNVFSDIDRNLDWSFLADFKRTEKSDFQPYDREEAISRVLHALKLPTQVEASPPVVFSLGQPLQSGKVARPVMPNSTKSTVRKQVPGIVAIILIFSLVGVSTFLYFFKTPSLSLVSYNSSTETQTQFPSVTPTPKISTPTKTVTPTIAITPTSPDAQNTSTVVSGIGTPLSTQPPSGAHQLSFTTLSRSLTVSATGQGTTPATFASGKLQIINSSTDSTKFINWPSGTVLYSSINSNTLPGVVLDQSANVPAPPATSTMIIQAHAQMAGSQGNMAANAFLLHCHAEDTNRGYCYGAKNITDFTGGAEAQSYTFVQQSDIDVTAKSLETPAPDPQQGFRSKLAANEHLIGKPSCSPQVSSVPAVNSKASTVTVTVVFTCTEQAQS